MRDGATREIFSLWSSAAERRRAEVEDPTVEASIRRASTARRSDAATVARARACRFLFSRGLSPRRKGGATSLISHTCCIFASALSACSMLPHRLVNSRLVSHNQPAPKVFAKGERGVRLSRVSSRFFASHAPHSLATASVAARSTSSSQARSMSVYGERRSRGGRRRSARRTTLGHLSSRFAFSRR